MHTLDPHNIQNRTLVTVVTPNVKGVLDQSLIIRYSRKRNGTRSDKVWFGQDLLGRDSQKTI